MLIARAFEERDALMQNEAVAADGGVSGDSDARAGASTGAWQSGARARARPGRRAHTRSRGAPRVETALRLGGDLEFEEEEEAEEDNDDGEEDDEADDDGGAEEGEGGSTV